MAKESAQNKAGFDPDVDRYPPIREAISRILSDVELPQGPVERLELTFLASGEGTYRVWTPRSDDPYGGYLEA